jgi:hypothetical protein
MENREILNEYMKKVEIAIENKIDNSKLKLALDNMIHDLTEDEDSPPPF